MLADTQWLRKEERMSVATAVHYCRRRPPITIISARWDFYYSLGFLALTYGPKVPKG